MIIPGLNNKNCIICEIEFNSQKNCICPACLRKSYFYNSSMLKRPHDIYDAAYALYYYDDDIKRLIYDIKINLNTELVFMLADMLAKKIDKIDADHITYVPAMPLKRIQKGFNPSKVLAEEIGRINNIKVKKLFFRKQRILGKETKKLNAIQRFEQISKDFHILKNINVRSENIIIVDDILTTGATMNRCAGLLKENGASAVIVCIIASGRKY